ncbi:MAG: hypothetical protein C4558_04740 [Dehalococcoidia bacterium]|nr:MAG: hypothetical protein C4558_04740 [Dehalococcoidia bacterium]
MRIHRAWEAAWRSRIAHAAAPTGADRLGNASQDAGWVHLVSTDGVLNYGRGHLKMWMERPGSPFPSGRQAQLESFAPSDIEPRRGDRVMIRPEIELATYPVIVREYKRGEDSTTVVLDWVEDDDLPAILLETGGNGPGENTASTKA